MTAFRKLITIQKSKAEVWSTLSALDLLHHFHPEVSESYYSSNQIGGGGVGSTRIGNMTPYGEIEERVIHWNKEQALSLKVTSLKRSLLKHLFSYFELFEIEPAQTRISLTIKYDVKHGVLGQWWNKRLFQPTLELYTSHLLIGLKAYLEYVHCKCNNTVINTL